MRLALLSHHPTLQLLALVIITISAYAETVSILPQRVDFGVVSVNLRIQSTITISNESEDVVKIKLSVGDPFSIATHTLTLQKATEQTVPVEFSVNAPGVYRSEIAVEVDKLFGADALVIPIEATAARPKLLLEPAAIDFNTLPVGKSAKRSLLIRNTGPVPLDIDSLHLSDRLGPFAIQFPSQLSFAPGTSGEVTIEFAPTRNGRTMESLTIASQELDPSEVEVTLEGEGLAAIAAISPLTEVGIEYGPLEVGKKLTATASILNYGRTDLEISEISLSGESFTLIREKLNTLEPDGRQDLKVVFNPTFPGPSKGTLTFNTNDPNRRHVSLPLQGKGVISPPEIIILTDDSIDLGSVALGKSSHYPLLIWNRGGSAFTAAVNVKENRDEFDIDAKSYLVQPGQSANIDLSFSPQTVGEREGILQIETEKGISSLHLFGTGRYLKLSPTAKDFGRIPVGEASNVIVDLDNIGNADFTITKVQSTSNDFAIYTQVAKEGEFTLPANSLRSMPINVIFTPSVRGMRNGTLRIEGFWEEGIETFEVLLNGTGIAAEIELHPSGPIDFGYVVIGETESRTLIATNTGDTPLRVAANALTREASIDPSGFSLKPGESTKFQVHFSPQTLGERFGQILLVSNDVHDKALPIKLKGHGALQTIDLAQLTSVTSSRNSQTRNLMVAWTGTPNVVIDGTRIDLGFEIPDSLRIALVGRQMEVEWVALDEAYGPIGGPNQLVVNIYDDDQRSVPVDALNLRMEENGLKRIRLKITTYSYPGAAPQTISQVFEVGGWKWEFEAKPLVSFLTIRPGRNYTDSDGNIIEGKTERLIGLPGIAFAGWHNPDNPSVSGLHLTATGNVLEALSTDNAIAVSLGLAVSAYKDRLLFGFGWDIYDSRPKPKRKGTEDYIITFKYSGLF